jgi:superfamily I DNA and/or RNA helicase
MNRPKPGLKIRQIIERAHGELLRLKPCFLMSPLSVAQYLPPSITFDIVVIDEASQLKVERALGTIARGAQVVIVGDSNQLPPSDYFQAKHRGDDHGNQDDSSSDESESILELASILYYPPRILTWHYRSKHQDLISFSNEKFYNNRLIVFPSPFLPDQERGVEFVHVQDGYYEDRQNEVEAKRIIADVIAHLHDYPDTSLGVVAMNRHQKELIDDLLEEALKSHNLAKRSFDQWEEKREDVFVKSLENVQGDERDVIFISLNIGKDKDGDLPLSRLGFLNRRSSGHRRLNVLISRARKRTVIYSSILPEDLKVSANNSRGAILLREYLDYARKVSDKSQDQRQQQGSTDFQNVICDALKNKGYETIPKVGVENYWIDVAVVHPNQKDQYILGIECDGALYYSSRSARDRDHLRQHALEQLGWNLHRIWSVDWVRNSDWEINRIVQRIEWLKRGPKKVGGDSSQITAYYQRLRSVRQTFADVSSRERARN